MLSGMMQYTNVPIPTHILTREMQDYLDNGTLSGGIRELESLLETDEPHFGRPWPNELIQYFNELDCVNIVLMSAQTRMSRTAIENVLDSVRTRLLEFIIEIEEINPNADAVPSLEKIAPTVTKRIFRKVIMNENYHGDVQKIEGVYGSNLATGQARISSSHATYTNTADAGTALLALKQHIQEVSEADRTKVEEAITLLIVAIQDNTIPKSRIVAAAEIVAAASDRMKQTLRELSIGVSGSLVASGVWEGIRYALGNS